MADSIIGKLIYKIVGDSSQLDKNVKKSNTAVQNLGKSTNKFGKIAKGALLAVGIGAVLMGKKLVTAMIQFGKESARAASDAEETAGKFSVVFSGISDAADASVQGLVDNFDLAASTAKSLLGDTGDLLTGFGFTQEAALDLSTQVNTLAIDLASFTNFSGGAEGASQALTKALLGERESIKSLGISILDVDVKAKVLQLTQEGLTFETERQAKAYATLQIALEQSKNAQGDYARTSESAVNVQRSLAEQIKRSKEITGTYINEALTPLRAGFRDLLKDINDAKEAQLEFNAAQAAGDTEKTDELIDSMGEYLGQIEKAIIFAETFGTASLTSASQLAKGFGLSKIKALELIAVFGTLDDAGQQTLEELLRLQEKNETVEAARIQNAEDAAEALKLESDAFKRLNEIVGSRVTAEEKQIALLQKEIDHWVQFREIAGVQTLLNELIAERNALQEDGNEALEEEFQLNTDLISLEEERDILIFAGQELRKKKAEELIELQKEEIANNILIAQSVVSAMNAIGSIFSTISNNAIQNVEDRKNAEIDAINEELETAMDAEEVNEELVDKLNDKKKIAEEAFDAEKKALQLQEFKRNKAFSLGEAVINTAVAIAKALPNPILTTFAAVTGAAQIAAIAAQQAPSFANGGIVAGSSTSGDNVKANVNSREMILTQAQQAKLFAMANGGSGSGLIHVIVNLEKQPIIDVVSEASKDGTMIIDPRSIHA